jgi:hypothetical protein
VVTADGVVDVAFPANLADGAASCSVACAGSAAGPEASEFSVFKGTVTQQLELADVSGGVQALIGSIGPINPTAFNLGNPGVFEVMTGSINVQCGGTSQLASVRAQALREIGGDVIVNDCDDAGFDVLLGALTNVGGGLQVQNNNAMNTLSLTALQSVGGGLTISTNEKLVAVEMATLRSIGSAGGPVDDFTFERNATTAAVGARVRVDLPVTGVRLFGRARILENRRLDIATAQSIADRFTADTAPLLADNSL